MKGNFIMSNLKDMRESGENLTEAINKATVATGDFQSYFHKTWQTLPFWYKVYFRLISIWGWIEFAWQITLHRVFGVDWHKNDSENDSEEE